MEILFKELMTPNGTQSPRTPGGHGDRHSKFICVKILGRVWRFARIINVSINPPAAVPEPEPDARLDRCEKLLIQIAKSVRLPSYLDRFLFGVVTGFGTVVGATLVVAIAVAILKPLERIGNFSPQVERLIDALNSRQGPNSSSHSVQPSPPTSPP